MKSVALAALLLFASLSLPQSASAQSDAKAGLLDKAQLKDVVPSSYFFAGKNAPVQMRNAAAARLSGGKLVLAALVDTSGYSANIQEKYQGLFITEAKISIEGKTLEPGEYGIGRTADGNFNILNVASDTLASFPGHADDSVKRPVPLQMTSQGSDKYRLYFGRNYVEFSPPQ